MRRSRLAALLPLSAVLCAMTAGCGSASDSTAAGKGSIGSGAAADTGSSAATAMRDGSVTAIDAALGDGAAMPADSHGPSTYDLALAHAARAGRAEAAGGPGAEPASASGAEAPPGATEPVPEDPVASGD